MKSCPLLEPCRTGIQATLTPMSTTMTSLRAASPASALNFPCSPRPASGSLCPFQRRPPGTKRSSSISCSGSQRPMRPVTHPCPCLLRAPPTTSTHALGIWGSVIVTVALIPGANLEGFRTPAETAQSQPAYSSPLTLNTRRVTPRLLPICCPRALCSSPKALQETPQALWLALQTDPPSYAQRNPGAVWVWGLHGGAWKLRG